MQERKHVFREFGDLADAAAVPRQQLVDGLCVKADAVGFAAVGCGCLQGGDGSLVAVRFTIGDDQDDFAALRQGM